MRTPLPGRPSARHTPHTRCGMSSKNTLECCYWLDHLYYLAADAGLDYRGRCGPAVVRPWAEVPDPAAPDPVGQIRHQRIVASARDRSEPAYDQATDQQLAGTAHRLRAEPGVGRLPFVRLTIAPGGLLASQQEQTGSRGHRASQCNQNDTFSLLMIFRGGGGRPGAPPVTRTETDRTDHLCIR
jgi:hypothetical protein